MKGLRRWHKLRLTRLRISPVSLIAITLVIAGLALGATVHKGFMILVAMGAFGPGILRQFNLLDDLDEFQQEAATQAGLRAYLVAATFLMVVVITGEWHRLDLGHGNIPAYVPVIIMLVVYYASYCLNFWDTRKAVSRILFAFGVLWLAFSVASARDLKIFLTAGMLVPGPFILGAILCRWWPRTVGLVLLCASVGAIFFFHMLPQSGMDSQRVFSIIAIITLIPLPLAVAGVALLTSRDESDER